MMYPICSLISDKRITDEEIIEKIDKHPVRCKLIRQVDEGGNTLLMKALDWVLRPRLVEYLLESGSDAHFVNEARGTPLSRACRSAYFEDGRAYEICVLILSYGADPNRISEDGSTLYRCIIGHCRQAILAILLYDGHLLEGEYEKMRESQISIKMLTDAYDSITLRDLARARLKRIIRSNQ